MKYPVVLFCALMVPFYASAHSDVHEAAGLLDGIVHMVGGHILPPAVLVAGLLVSSQLYEHHSSPEDRRVHDLLRETHP